MDHKDVIIQDLRADKKKLTEELEQWRERGILPPCKVGDKLYTIILGRIEVYEVSGFLADRHGVMLRLETKGMVKSRFIESEQLGKTIFPTEQEAQSALEKMKGE